MSLGLDTAIRNARLELLADALDVASNPGTLKIYSGTHPGTGVAPGVGNTLLATLTFSLPCVEVGGIAAGVLTFDTITGENAVADGTAAWARAADGDDTFVCDFKSVTATGGGGDIILNTVSITTGSPVTVVSAAITEGNP